MAKPSKPVGYGSPPVHSRFQPGRSGNPNGRPKNTPSFNELLEREGRRLIQLKTADGTKSISKLEGLVRRLYQKAMEGDLGAARLIVQATASRDTDQLDTALDKVIDANAVDDAVIERMLERLKPAPKGKAP